MSSLYRQSAPSLSVAITFPGDFFLFTTPVEVANKYIAIILGKPSIISFQIWSAKVLGGALQIFNFPFGKTISAKGGWDRVSTSHNCFD